MRVSTPAISMTFPPLWGRIWCTRASTPATVIMAMHAASYPRSCLQEASTANDAQCIHCMRPSALQLGEVLSSIPFREWYGCTRANAPAIVVVSFMCEVPCGRILLQDKYKDAFPCLFLFPLTHGDKWLTITSQEVARIFLHAFPKKHVWFLFVRPPPREVGRIILHAVPCEACLALGNETSTRVFR